MKASKAQQASLERLTQREDFVKLNKQGRRWVSHGLILQAIPNDLPHTRVGFTVTKRTEAKAVKRNRIKRRLRAVAADILPVYAQDNHDYVLIGKSLTRTRPYDNLCNDLKWCLKKMDLRKDNHA
jgi:ribonuclease P protein component